MSKKQWIMVAVPTLVVATLSFSFFQRGKNAEGKDQIVTELVFKSLNQAHFSAQELNDGFSAKSFKAYIKTLDPTKRFLLQEDFNALKAYELRMDDLAKERNMEMLNLAKQLMKTRVAEAKVYCNAILEQPFDFNVAETFETDADKRGFAQSKDELKEVWRKSLKYQALVRYETAMQEQATKMKAAKEKGETFEAKSEAQLEEEARKQLAKTYRNVFDAMEKESDDDRTAEYINAMVGVYDPHTEYFPPAEKENFDISMAGKLEGIGAQLQQADGEIKVSKIVPGSASWKQKELSEGDIVLKVAQGEEEPVDVTDMQLKDAVQLIRGKKGTEVRLTVKKPTGVIKVIPIIRDVVILEENFAKSAVIQDQKRNRKYGYIKLPSFYADFNQSGGRYSAQDVKLELEKLKKEGVEGIVLDLRFNGGGSLSDAVKMTGLFIEKGPVVQVKTSFGPSKVWEDQDASVTWDGPLVVLVNKFSASASEILAGALQDYERAVIVGTPSTFGKGTVQQFIDLDEYMQFGGNQYKPLGSLKLTIQKFYRVTGKSTQWKGVEPDIVLPDSYSFIEGEQDMDNALPWDEVSGVSFKRWNETVAVKNLQKHSKKRIKDSPAFALMEENATRLKQLRDETVLPLNYAQYKAQQERLEKDAKRFEGIKVKHAHWSVSPMPSNVKNDDAKEQRDALNKAWQQEITEDETLSEATFIIDDILSKIK
jgi:carboxyl-terminal processing protease